MVGSIFWRGNRVEIRFIKLDRLLVVFDVVAVGVLAGLAAYVYNEVYKFVKSSLQLAVAAAVVASAIAFVGRVVGW